MHWITQHQVIVSIIGTWLFNNVITVMVSSLPSPTKDSSAGYVYWFKVANSIIGNLSRAASTALEHSPNWQDAVSQRQNMIRAADAAGNIGDPVK